MQSQPHLDPVTVSSGDVPDAGALQAARSRGYNLMVTAVLLILGLSFMTQFR